MSRYETTFFSYFESIKSYLKVQPLLLGGGSGDNGGSGGPPGGFIGQLPQSRVAYDLTELASSATPSSGQSLVDNLNHIRYRLGSLEVSTSGISIKNQGVLLDTGVTVIDVESPLYAESVSGNEVVITYSGQSRGDSYSGIWSEDLTAYTNGISTTFYTSNTIYDTSARVYLNGERVNPSLITIIGAGDGFELDSPPASGAVLVVDYETPQPNPGHTHSIYRLISDSYSAAESNVNFAPYTHTHFEADILDLSHNAEMINWVPVSGVPVDGQLLSYSSALNLWQPTTIPGLVPQSIKQQMLMTIAGTLTTLGTSPLAIYAHDVSATIDEIFLSLGSVAGTTAIRVNILKNGSTILNSPGYIEIPVGIPTKSETSFLVNTFTENDKFEIDLVQGDDDASYLVAHIRFSWDL